MKVLLALFSLFVVSLSRHIIVPYSTPLDLYHELHVPHDPPLYPTHHAPPPTAFSCARRSDGFYSDVDASCQVFHRCQEHKITNTNLCTNGTLFNEQFQVCDQFYNVRCGSPYEDL